MLIKDHYPKELVVKELTKDVRELPYISLRRFVKLGMEKGVDVDELRETLIEKGWQKEAIDKAIHSVKDNNM